MLSTSNQRPDSDPDGAGNEVCPDERVRIRSLSSGVDIYGRVRSVEDGAIEVETFDRSNSLVSLGRGTEAEVAVFDSAHIDVFTARVIEDSGRTVRVSHVPEGLRVERRAHQRAECWLPGEIGPTSEARAPVPCRVLNVSVGGVLIACAPRIPTGARLELSFPIPGSARTVAAAVDVVREGAVRPDGDHLYGCAFARLDMEDALALADAIVESVREGGQDTAS